MSDEQGTGEEAGLAAEGPATRLTGYAPQTGIGLCYLATVLGGMALADEAAAAGLALFDDPGHLHNVGIFAGIVLAATAVMLLAFRYGLGEALLRVFLVVVFGMLAADAVLLAIGAGDAVASGHLLGGLPTSPLGLGLTAVAAVALWAYPEWYVIDVVGILAGAAAIAIIGLGFGPLPIVVLLVVWAGYDAYAVYWSGHMKELAAGVGTLKVPVVFVVPTELGASFRDAGLSAITDGSDDGGGDDASDGAEAAGEGEDDSIPVAMMGLGDALIPGMLAVSAGQFLDAPTLVPALNANAPALGALAGVVAGLFALALIGRRFGGVHAGLPPLNAGVLGGYLLGTLAAGLPLAAAVGL